MSSRICIRADASAVIGAGHVARCLALADELRRRGADVAFLTRSSRKPWGASIEAHGHRFVPLAGDIADEMADAQATVAAIEALGGCEWLVLDSYALGIGWERAVRPSVKRILVVDDLDRSHACDLLVDQNVIDAAERYTQIEGDCIKLLGPRYGLLRDEFPAARRRLARQPNECRRVLINFGGSDPTGEIAKAIEAFLRAGLGEVRAHVVLGAANSRADELHRRYDGHPLLDILDQSERMAELMCEADIAIGAGGSSTWERACLGLPSLVVSVADNQETIAMRLAEEGCHCYLGRAEEVDVERMATALRFLVQTASLRTALGRASSALCDGAGARRVADGMIGAEAVTVRRATPADSAAILAWRNSEPVRRASPDATPIALADHERWFASVLDDSARVLLIGEDAAGPVGVVRFDIAGEQAVVSIYLVPERIGAGSGGALLAAAEGWLSAYVGGLREIHARVMAGNERSAALFERAGYRRLDSNFCKTLAGRGKP